MARIMVVDDNRDMVDMLCLALGIVGHEPIAAYGGEQALELVASQVPDMILLDWLMPRLSGHETLQRLRALPEVNGLPVVVITAMDEAEVKEYAISEGATTCLMKPVSLNALTTCIEQYVDLPMPVGSDRLVPRLNRRS